MQDKKAWRVHLFYVGEADRTQYPLRFRKRRQVGCLIGGHHTYFLGIGTETQLVVLLLYQDERYLMVMACFENAPEWTAMGTCWLKRLLIAKGEQSRGGVAALGPG